MQKDEQQQKTKQKQRKKIRRNNSAVNAYTQLDICRKENMPREMQSRNLLWDLSSSLFAVSVDCCQS